MKRLFTILFLGLAIMTTTSCVKEEEENNGNDNGQTKTYYYNLYTDYQNYHQSNIEYFAPLWDEDGVRMDMIESTSVEEANARAIQIFDSILALIDDEIACQGLDGDDYMKAILQRLEGGPHDIKGKQWTAAGATTF